MLEGFKGVKIWCFKASRKNLVLEGFKEGAGVRRRKAAAALAAGFGSSQQQRPPGLLEH